MRPKYAEPERRQLKNRTLEKSRIDLKGPSGREKTSRKTHLQVVYQA